MSIAYSTAFIEKTSDILAMIMILDEAWEKFAKRTEATEDKFKPKLKAVFDKQQVSVLARMADKPVPQLSKTFKLLADVLQYWLDTDGTKAVTDEAEAAAEAYLNGVFNPKEWQVTFQEVELPFTTAAMAEAGEAAMVEVGLGGGFNVTNPVAKKLLQERAFKFAKEVNETTQERLRTALAQGFDLGEGIKELEKRVAGVFDIAKGSRTEMIARTEVVGASNQGTNEGYIQSGIVLTNIWVNSRDNKVRELHGIDGEEVELEKRFSNGLRFPHDPRGSAGNVINCRCTHIAGKLKE